MPLITSATITSPTSPSQPFNGVLILSKTAGGCASGSDCEIVSFVNGTQSRHWSRGRYSGLVEGTLPMVLDSGTWYYRQIAGDPVLMLCDWSNVCADMERVTTIGASANWASLIATSTPVVGTSIATTDYWLKLKAENDELKAENARLTNQLAACVGTEEPGAVASVIAGLTIEAGCR